MVLTRPAIPLEFSMPLGKPSAGSLLGAHISTRGGVSLAPARARTIGATAMQIFTTSPSQWRARRVSAREGKAFQAARERAGLGLVVAHDSYLINLASPDPLLRARSVRAFVSELRRSTRLGLDAVVTHPGNYIDAPAAGIARNAASYTRCLRAVPGSLMIYVEATAGTGTALGATFEELAQLRNAVADDVRERVAFCADTCHLVAAGYDLVNDFEGVWARWDRIIGLPLLRCLHLNDSKTPLGSRRDRHALIGEGTLGREPFRRLMTDPAFVAVPKILETPKGEDEVTNDRRMMRMLRRFERAPTAQGGR